MQPGIWFPAVKAHTGTDVFTEQLAAGLRRFGFKAEITWLPRRAEYAPWSVNVPPTPTWANIVHVSSWLATRFMPSDLPIVATIHHSIHDLRLSPYKGVLRSLYHRLWIQYVERSNLDRANAVVAVSTAAALEAKRVFGHRYIQVIHNGVDTGGLLLLPRTLPNKPFRLIYIGAWKVLKGAHLFPEIMQKLGSGFELHCVGGMPENREKINLPDNIKLHGRIDDRVRLISIMQEADALLFPSLSEGFGLVMAESQACGLPVIASDCSCMREIVVDGETGILCSENDASAFADGVRKLANQNDLWRSMRLAAYSFAVRNFSMERQVADYAHLYRLLLGQYERAD